MCGAVTAIAVGAWFVFVDHKMFRVVKKIENAHDDSVWAVAYGAGCFVSGSVDETVCDFPARSILRIASLIAYRIGFASDDL